MITLTRTQGPGSTKDTISWAPITGLLGYKFTVDGKISHTWDNTRTTLVVSRGAERILVEAFGTKDSGVWPPVTPPPTLLFNGDFDTGNFSRWKNHEMLAQAAVVTVPERGFVMRAQTSGSVSMVNVGQNFEDYQLPWEVIPAKVWHRVDILLPSGNLSGYPGTFVRSTPGSGWDMFWELHDRTDAASGYGPSTPGSYGSTMLTVQGQATDLRWQIRMAGHTLPQPVNTFFSHSAPVQRDRWYRHDIYIDHHHLTGNAEWWIDGVKVWTGTSIPTAFLCADGLSGERLQCGIYRGAFSGTTTVYLDNIRVANTRADLG